MDIHFYNIENINADLNLFLSPIDKHIILYLVIGILFNQIKKSIKIKK